MSKCYFKKYFYIENQHVFSRKQKIKIKIKDLLYEKSECVFYACTFIKTITQAHVCGVYAQQ